MASFITHVKTMELILAPGAVGHLWRKHYIGNSSEEEVAEGSPLAQPLMDIPEPEPDSST